MYLLDRSHSPIFSREFVEIDSLVRRAAILVPERERKLGRVQKSRG